MRDQKRYSLPQPQLVSFPTTKNNNNESQNNNSIKGTISITNIKTNLKPSIASRLTIPGSAKLGHNSQSSDQSQLSPQLLPSSDPLRSSLLQNNYFLGGIQQKLSESISLKQHLTQSKQDELIQGQSKQSGSLTQREFNNSSRKKRSQLKTSRTQMITKESFTNSHQQLTKQHNGIISLSEQYQSQDYSQFLSKSLGMQQQHNLPATAAAGSSRIEQYYQNDKDKDRKNKTTFKNLITPSSGSSTSIKKISQSSSQSSVVLQGQSYAQKHFISSNQSKLNIEKNNHNNINNGWSSARGQNTDRKSIKNHNNKTTNGSSVNSLLNCLIQSEDQRTSKLANSCLLENKIPLIKPSRQNIFNISQNSPILPFQSTQQSSLLSPLPLNTNPQEYSPLMHNPQLPLSDGQQCYIKKTQHIIKGLIGPNGTTFANNQEHIEDFEEDVIKMMQGSSLYQQSLNGRVSQSDPTKCSNRGNGIVTSYGAKTHQGLVRGYNEDRVSIILNIIKPASRMNDNNTQPWPKCSFFGVYDGHGGVSCADFLRDNLHQFVIRDNNFPNNPSQAIINGFAAAESHFLQFAKTINGSKTTIEKSGSCALVVLIVDDMCYVANVGDSRAVMSSQSGQSIVALTRDHKPMDEVENTRIHLNNGSVYQTKIESMPQGKLTNSFTSTFNSTMGGGSNWNNNENTPPSPMITGPYRVLPGRLSVTRTFGDIDAKLPAYGGNPNVVIATPEIKTFKILPEHDFIVLGCDGIFDKVRSNEIGQVVWEMLKEKQTLNNNSKGVSKNDNNNINVHQFCVYAVETILDLAIARKTYDNVTAVIIGFKHLEKAISGIDTKGTRNERILKINNDENNQKEAIGNGQKKVLEMK